MGSGLAGQKHDSADKTRMNSCLLHEIPGLVKYNSRSWACISASINFQLDLSCDAA